MSFRLLILLLTGALLPSSCSFMIAQHESGVRSGQTPDSSLPVGKTSLASTPLPGEKMATHDGTDLWRLVRSGFSFPQENHSRIAKAFKQYRKNPHAIEQSFSKAAPYLQYVFSQTAKRGLPAELVLLPFVESTYDPFAFSNERASGLWQFIPGTGKQFGLQQNWWYDGRRDVVASTNAALDYLEQLNTEFDGDWLHTLAAYNAGGGTLRKAIRKNREAGKPVDYWSLRLPVETTHYVPKLLALKTIIIEPSRHGFEFETITPKPVFIAVNTGSQIDLAIAAELAEIEISELQALNPGLNRWATPPEGPHQLVIPRDNAEKFKTALENLPEDKRIKWVRHKIRKGGTLSHIAVQYKTTTAVIKQINGLGGNTIKIGHHLLVPVSAKDPQVYAALGFGKNYRNRKTTYTVQPGDSLWKIARSHHVSTRNLTDWNRLNKNMYIKPGQKLVIWIADRVPAGRTNRHITYTIRKGDSLFAISRKFNVSIDSLKRWNSLSTRKYLQPGDKLEIHVDVTQQALSG
jgi:membrane-bound lytic murein transglycosylase D